MSKTEEMYLLLKSPLTSSGLSKIIEVKKEDILKVCEPKDINQVLLLTY